MKTISCPLCHIIMTQVAEIINADRQRKSLSEEQLKLFHVKENYALMVDQGLPTQRRYEFFECQGCGLVLLFNEDKLK